MGINNLYKQGFPKSLEKKLDKTKEGRQGDPLYKRRNGRHSTRSLMLLTTFLSLTDNDLKHYNNGYIVILSPEEYFDPKSLQRKEDLDERIVVGENAIVYYQNNDNMWEKYNPLNIEGWEQVVEKSSEIGDWSGHFAVNITNAQEKKLSYIVRKDQKKSANVFNWMPSHISDVESRVNSGLGGKGLGNYDFDYCDEVELEKILFQLSFLIWNTQNIEAYLIDLYKSNPNKWSSSQINKIKKIGIEKWIEDSKQNVFKYVEENNLNDKNLLNENRVTSLGEVACPLCLVSIQSDELTKVVQQDSGRESSQQTITEIVLMHIKPLYPGKFHHKSYNLGWGHKHCNTIQENMTIEETLEKLITILRNNNTI